MKPTSWKLLTKAPLVGDVLFHEENDLVVMIIRRRCGIAVKALEVDVLWLHSHNHNGSVSTHYGGFDSWKGWRKL